MSSTTPSLSSSYPENICPCRGHFLPTRQATQNRDFLRNRFLLEIASTKEIQGVWLCWTIPRNGKANTNFLLFGLIFWFQLTWSPKLTSLFCMYESFIQTEDDQWFLARESEESKGFLATSLTRIFEQLFCPPPNLFRRSLNRIEKYEIKAWWVMICVLISISISRSPPKTEQLNLRLQSGLVNSYLFQRNLFSSSFDSEECNIYIWDTFKKGAEHSTSCTFIFLDLICPSFCTNTTLTSSFGMGNDLVLKHSRASLCE